MGESSESNNPSKVYMAKYMVAKTSIIALGTAFELASKWDVKTQAIIEEMEEGMVFAMGVLPAGPNGYFKKEGSRVEFLGTGDKPYDVGFFFKNMEAAMLSFTGQIGTQTAVSQHRIIARGNLAEAMKISRAMEVVQTFMFPAIILNKTYKNPPKLSLKELWIKTKVMAGLGPGLAVNFMK